MTNRALLRRRGAAGAGPHPCRPAVERLEERLALAVFTVSNVLDGGPGSLRQAILDANAVVTADTIVFDAAVFSTPRTIDIQNLPLPQFGAVSGGLTIVGPGSGLLTVRKLLLGPSVTRRVFDSFAPTLAMSGMTVTGGNATASGGGLNVGGSQPNVTLDDMVFTGNTTNFNNDGGAIALTNNATLTIRNSVVANNDGRLGGGISFVGGGSLVMENTTVSDNQSFGGSARGGSGGGIYFFGAARTAVPAGYTPGTLVIRNSTIANNRAAQSGGGVSVDTFTGTFLIENSTVSGNTAGASGGGVAQTGGNGTLTLRNATVTANTSNGRSDFFPLGSGGGVAQIPDAPAVVNVVNSVVSGNTHPVAPDIRADASTTTHVNYSAVGSPDGFTLSASSGNNRPFGSDPMLGPLADNGGRTRTHALLPGSPLVNAGSNARVPAGLTTDQRGPGFPRIVGAAVDIGAYERSQAPAVTRVYVAGGAWTAAFKNYLQSRGVGDAAFGYAIPAGAAQLQTLPWIATDRISFRFGQDVAFGAGDLAVSGVNTAAYPVVGYAYDSSTFTGTWTLGQPLRNDKVLLKLGDFRFRLNALPGDVDRGGVVVATDYTEVKKKFFKSTTSPVTGTDADYTAFHDVDGSGTILANDYSEVKSRFFHSLPGPEPAALAAAPAGWTERVRPAEELLA